MDMATADRFPGQTQGGTLPDFQGPLVEGTSHDVDVLAQIPQDLPGVFRGVLIGDQLELNVRAVGVEAGPQVQQKLSRRHGEVPMRMT